MSLTAVLAATGFALDAGHDDGTTSHHMTDHPGAGMGWAAGWAPVWWVVGSLVLVGVVTIVAVAVHGIRNPVGRGHASNASAVLDERLARGEISVDEHKTIATEIDRARRASGASSRKDR